MPRIIMDRSGEMEVFARVVQEGAFSRAARNLDLTPSAVSRVIARLEARLGARLLVRTTRVLTLTAEGESYYAAARRILQDLDEADEAAGAGGVRGRIRISASIPFGSMFIAPLAGAFLRDHPGVVIDLSLTDDVVDLVAQRTDLAIRIGDLQDSPLIARKLGQSRVVVVASPGYLARQGAPQGPADLAGHQCIRFNFRRAAIGWPFLRDGERYEQPVSGALLVNNGETLRQMAVAGAGIARMGLYHAAPEIEAGRLQVILQDHNPGDVELISAVYVGGGPLPARVRAFIDYAAAALARSSQLKAAS